MIQRSEKGKQARQYFIACEKRLFTPKVTTHLDVIDSGRALLVANEKTNTSLLQANDKLEADKLNFSFKALITLIKIYFLLRYNISNIICQIRFSKMKLQLIYSIKKNRT
jgi:hypothetical protein